MNVRSASAGDARPSTRRAEVASLAIVMALAVVVQLPFHTRAFVELDEGHLLTAAERVRQGDVLYRDVHTGVFPGIYLATATLFALFGTDVAVMRGAQLVVNAATAGLLWALGSRVSRWPWSGLPPLLYGALVVVGFPALTMLNYSTTALACALAAVVALLRFLARGRRVDGILAGAALAACALTKQSTGVFTAIALVITLLATRRRSALAEPGTLAALLPLAIGAVPLVAAAVAYLVYVGAIGDWIGATTGAAFASQLRNFHFPIPLLGHPARDPVSAFVYAPPALYALALNGGAPLGVAIPLGAAIRLSYWPPVLTLALAPALLWNSRKRSDDEWRALVAIVAAAALLFLTTFPFANWPHFAFATVPTVLLAAVLAERTARGLARIAWTAARAWCGVVTAAAAAIIVTLVALPYAFRVWHDVPMDVPHASLVVSADVARRHRAAVAFLRDCAGPTDPIFTAPTLPQLYTLAERRNPTPYDLLIPGTVDAAEIVRTLEATRTRCVVYTRAVMPGLPPLGRLFPQLARYLHTHYRRTRTFDDAGARWYALVRRPVEAASREPSPE